MPNRKLEHLISTMRQAADFLRRFTSARVSTPGTLIWNGKDYAKPDMSCVGNPNPYTLSWQNILLVSLELLDKQGSEVTCEQLEYLSHLLCGGAGSFNDFSLSLDDGLLENQLSKANDDLTMIRTSVCDALKALANG